MELLVNRLGLDLDQRPSELTRDLGGIPANTLASVREVLFQEAKTLSLTAVGSVLVQRRKTNGGNSVKQKHVSDIIVLVRSIQNKTPLPRSVLRNGKRSAKEWEASQVRQPIPGSPSAEEREASQLRQSIPASPPADLANRGFDLDQWTSELVRDPEGPPQRMTANEKVFRSTIARDVGQLKSELDALKFDVQEIRSNLPHELSQSDLDTCMLYVRLKKPATSEVGV